MRPKRLTGLINANKANTSTCMVVDCERVAIYRNAQSVSASGTVRGYCSKHKELAVSDNAFGYGWKPQPESDFDPWIPLCSDKD